MGTIELDYTFFIQLANFIVTLVVLNFILIKPVREQISSRKSLIDGYLGKIESFTGQASEKLSNYEASLEEARDQARGEREALKEEAYAEEQDLIKNAHTEAHLFLTESREETAKKIKVTTAELLKQTPDFSKLVVARMLQ